MALLFVFISRHVSTHLARLKFVRVSSNVYISCTRHPSFCLTSRSSTSLIEAMKFLCLISWLTLWVTEALASRGAGPYQVCCSLPITLNELLI